jgi:hypothetical protein
MDASTALRNAAKHLNSAAELMEKSEREDNFDYVEWADEQIALAFAELQAADYDLELFTERAADVM